MSKSVEDIRGEIESRIGAPQPIPDGGVLQQDMSGLKQLRSSGGGLYSGSSGLYAGNSGSMAAPEAPVIPQSGGARIMVETPGRFDAEDGDLAEIQRYVRETVGAEPEMRLTSEGAIAGAFDPQATGEDLLFDHRTIDFIEAGVHDVLGDGGRSTLSLAGDVAGDSVQPCFHMGERFDQETLRGLETAFTQLTKMFGVTFYYNRTRLYVDTDTDRLSHNALDTAEILVRREAMARGIGITKHTVKPLPRQ